MNGSLFAFQTLHFLCKAASKKEAAILSSIEFDLYKHTLNRQLFIYELSNLWLEHFFSLSIFFKLSYLASSFFGNFFRNLLGNKFKFFDVFIRNLICIYVFQAIFFSIVIKFRSIKLELSGKFCILDNFVSEISRSFH